MIRPAKTSMLHRSAKAPEPGRMINVVHEI